MQLILKDKTLKNSQIQKGYQRITNFTWSNNANCTLKILTDFNV